MQTGPQYSRQDARHVTPVLDLATYDAEQMRADLGDHRRTELPLAGAVVVGGPPPPNANKFGRKAARAANNAADVAAAWGTLYDPSLAEERDDGLGDGHTHRLGENYRPSARALDGKPLRARSHSPRGRRGSFQLREIAPKRIARPVPPLGLGTTLSNGGVLRRVRPRGEGQTKPINDNRPLAAQIGNRRSSSMGPVARPPKMPVVASQDDPNVGHWHAGRLVINRDNMEFFGKKPNVTSGNTPATPPANRGLDSSIHAPKPTRAPKAPINAPKAPINAPKAPINAPKAPINAPKAPINAPKAPAIIAQNRPAAQERGRTRAPPVSPAYASKSAPVTDTLDANRLAMSGANMPPHLRPKAAPPAQMPASKAPDASPSGLPKDNGTSHAGISFSSVKKTPAEIEREIEALKAEMTSAKADITSKNAQLATLEVEEKDLSGRLADTRINKTEIVSFIKERQNVTTNAQVSINKLEDALVKVRKEEDERLEKERSEKERLEKERAEKELAEKERVAKELAEKARLESKRREQERVEKEHANKEQLEKDRLDQQRRERERFDKQRAEKRQKEKARHAPSPDSDGASDSVGLTFPYRVKVGIRPVFDMDEIIVSLDQGINPNNVIKNELRKVLTEDKFNHLTSLEPFDRFLASVSRRYYSRMAKVYGGHG